MTEMIGEEILPSLASRVTPAKNPAEAWLRAGMSLTITIDCWQSEWKFLRVKMARPA